MLRLMCFSLFALASAFHFGNVLRGRNELRNYDVQLVEFGEFPQQRHSLCLPTPFIRQICLPTALQFFMPLQTLGTGRQRCLTVPIMTTYVVKVCPPAESAPAVKNYPTTSKEVDEEVDEEAETERLPDNTNSEVKSGEAELEYAVREEGNPESEESKVKDKSAQTKSNIVRTSEETGISEVNNFLQQQPIDDENISITSNFV